MLNKEKHVQTEEYNISIPTEQTVYYDTVLDRTITVTEVDRDEKFVTHRVDEDEQELVVETLDRFFAWLAAARYLAIGERVDGQIEIEEEQLIRAFTETYSAFPRQDSPLEIAQAVLKKQIGEDLVQPSP